MARISGGLPRLAPRQDVGHQVEEEAARRLQRAARLYRGERGITRTEAELLRLASRKEAELAVSGEIWVGTHVLFAHLPHRLEVRAPRSRLRWDTIASSSGAPVLLYIAWDGRLLLRVCGAEMAIYHPAPLEISGSSVRLEKNGSIRCVEEAESLALVLGDSGEFPPPSPAFILDAFETASVLLARHMLEMQLLLAQEEGWTWPRVMEAIARALDSPSSP